MSGPQRGLGRGLDSLIPTQLPGSNPAQPGTTNDVARPVARPSDNQNLNPKGEVKVDAVIQVAPNDIQPNPHQPRTEFEPEALTDLADSLKTHGILQPLVATKSADGYQLIAGERRLRAAKQAGLKTVPVIVRSFDSQQKLELALIENIQRSQLNAIETAKAYRKLMDEFHLDLDAVSRRVGKAKSTVSNQLRLLSLPPAVQAAIANGQIAEAHGRALLSIDSPQRQDELLKQIIDQSLSVRQIEELARAHKAAPTPAASQPPARPDIPSASSLVAGELSTALHTKVIIQAKAKGGRLIISYRDTAELQRISSSITKKV